MSFKWLGRAHGIAITCNEGTLEAGTGPCSARHVTANCVPWVNREAAKAAGWIRGRSPSRRSMDFCPVHAPIEIKRAEAEKATKLAEREDRFKAKVAKLLAAGERAERARLKREAKEAKRREREEARAAKKAARAKQPHPEVSNEHAMAAVTIATTVARMDAYERSGKP